MELIRGDFLSVQGVVDAAQTLADCCNQLQAENADLGEHALDTQWLGAKCEWSAKTFGPGRRTIGVLQHIRKELDEIANDPSDLSEWADVVLLALDGAWRMGFSPYHIIEGIRGKQARNEARTWPDYREFTEGDPIEHVKTVGNNNDAT